jgi:hypothetical protein
LPLFLVNLIVMSCLFKMLQAMSINSKLRHLLSLPAFHPSHRTKSRCDSLGFNTTCPYRGRYDLIFTATHLALRNPRNLLKIRYQEIQCVYILDGMKEERAGKVYLLLQFLDDVSVALNKKVLHNFTIETKDAATLDIPSPLSTSGGIQHPNVQVRLLLTS